MRSLGLAVGVRHHARVGADPRAEDRCRSCRIDEIEFGDFHRADHVRSDGSFVVHRDAELLGDDVFPFPPGRMPRGSSLPTSAPAAQEIVPSPPETSNASGRVGDRTRRSIVAGISSALWVTVHSHRVPASFMTRWRTERTGFACPDAGLIRTWTDWGGFFNGRLLLGSTCGGPRVGHTIGNERPGSTSGITHKPVSQVTQFSGYRGLIETHGRPMGEIPRLAGAPGKSLNRSHLRPRKPVVLQGLMDSWPARTKWTFEFFKEHYGDVKVPTGVVFSEKKDQPLGEYIDYLESFERGEESGPADLHGGVVLPCLQRGVCARISRFPECLRDDWFETWYPKRKNPKGTGILMGPEGAFTKLHTDGQRTHTWLAQFVGRKHWILVDYEFLVPVAEHEGRVQWPVRGLRTSRTRGLLEGERGRVLDM